MRLVFSHGASVVFPWDLHRSSMDLPWDFNGASMRIPSSYGASVGVSMGLLWGFHGTFKFPW